MLARNGAGPVPVGNGAGIDVTEHHLFSRLQTKPQDIRAELTGSTTCTAAGITAQGHAPALLLCRQLLAQGLDPDAALQVFRNGTLALRIRSLSEGAGLAVEDNRHGQPVFRPYRDRGVGTAPPVRQNGRGRP